MHQPRVCSLLDLFQADAFLCARTSHKFAQTHRHTKTYTNIHARAHTNQARHTKHTHQCTASLLRHPIRKDALLHTNTQTDIKSHARTHGLYCTIHIMTDRRSHMHVTFRRNGRVLRRICGTLQGNGRVFRHYGEIWQRNGVTFHFVTAIGRVTTGHSVALKGQSELTEGHSNVMTEHSNVTEGHSSAPNEHISVMTGKLIVMARALRQAIPT